MEFLRNLGIEGKNYGTSTGQRFWGTDGGEIISSTTPIDGSHITDTSVTTRQEYDEVVKKHRKPLLPGEWYPPLSGAKLFGKSGLSCENIKRISADLFLMKWGKFTRKD